MSEANNEQTVEPTTAPETPAQNPGSLIANTPAPTETQTDPAKPVDPNAPKLLAGKYKDVEALEKAHKELESKLGKQAVIPETYEVDATLQKHELTFKDDADREARLTPALTKMKEAKFTQAQVDIAMEIYAAQVKANQQTVAQYGPPTDPQKEVATVQKAWGDEAPSRFAALGKFMESLPKEVRTAPLENTAAGVEMLYEMMIAKRGPEFIKDVGSASAGPSKAALAEVVSHPDYYLPGARGDAKRAEAARISEALDKMRK